MSAESSLNKQIELEQKLDQALDTMTPWIEAYVTVIEKTLQIESNEELSDEKMLELITKAKQRQKIYAAFSYANNSVSGKLTGLQDWNFWSETLTMRQKTHIAIEAIEDYCIKFGINLTRTSLVPSEKELNSTKTLQEAYELGKIFAKEKKLDQQY